MTDALELFASRFTPPEPPPGGAGASLRSVCIPSLTGSSDAFLALSLATGAAACERRGGVRQPRIVLAVTPGLPDADRLTDDLRLLSQKKKLLKKRKKKLLTRRIRTARLKRRRSFRENPRRSLSIFRMVNTRSMLS